MARKAADIHWLHEGFEYAKRVRAKGVMVIQQADLNFNNEQHLADTRSWDAFPDYVNALRDETLGFRGQVALVHGDSHYFKVDKPLNGPSDGVLVNFTRVETFGARNTHWVQRENRPGRSEPLRVRAARRACERSVRKKTGAPMVFAVGALVALLNRGGGGPFLCFFRVLGVRGFPPDIKMALAAGAPRVGKPPKKKIRVRKKNTGGEKKPFARDIAQLREQGWREA